MPVDAKHPLYEKYSPRWTKCRDVCSGEDDVKDQGELYLPALKRDDKIEYRKYRDRAMFYSASERTIAGLLGAVFRKKPTVDPEQLETEPLGKAHENLFLISLKALYEVLVASRVGGLVDVGRTESQAVKARPYIVLYQAEDIINWKYETTPDGLKLTLVVLGEMYQDPDPVDPFKHDDKPQYRVLKIEEGKYVGEVWRKIEDKWVKHDEYIPKSVGKPLEYIPFTFMNCQDTTADIHNAPILPVVNVNLSHYRSSADLENGRHFVGLPIPYAAGFDIPDDSFQVGSEVGYVSKEPNAKIGYGEFTGKGLTFLENALKDKENLMAVLGARLLEASKLGVEKPEAMRLRQVGEHNSLRQVASSVSEGMTQLLIWWKEWAKAGGKDPSIQLNQDFMSDRMSPAELKELMFGWQSKGMSWTTLFYNLKRGEMYPEGWTEDQEKEAIDAEISQPTVVEPEPREKEVETEGEEE